MLKQLEGVPGEDKEEILPIETCRVISVVTEIDFKEMNSEACLMVLQTDDSSEGNLYFPDESDSEPTMTSKLKHMKLGSDSESSSQLSESMEVDLEEDASSERSEPDEIAQVQLRSGRVLPSPKKKFTQKDKGQEIEVNEEIIPIEDKKKSTSNKGVD